MATVVSAAYSELVDSSGFVFIETTGNTSGGNPNGWNGGNTAWSTAYYAEITIHDAAGNVVGSADTEYSFTLFDSTPSSTVWSTPRFTILAADYGLSNGFLDGVYQITYTARLTSGGTIVSSYSLYVLFSSFTQVNLKEAELSLPTCKCKDLGIVLQDYRALLVSYQLMVQSGTYTIAQDGITKLFTDSQNICFPCK